MQEMRDLAREWSAMDGEARQQYATHARNRFHAAQLQKALASAEPGESTNPTHQHRAALWGLNSR
eukprot:1385184-Lingulodinium_polyedra.AAC.1